MKIFASLLFLLYIRHIALVSVRAEDLDEQTILSTILKNYTHTMVPRPGEAGRGSKIILNFYIRRVYDLDTVNGECSLQITLRLEWTETRLEYKSRFPGKTIPDFVALEGDDVDKVWIPDTFIANEKDAKRHMIDRPNTLIRIYSTGKLLYSTRLSVTVFFAPSWEQYPFDTSEVSIDFASYKYSENILDFDWKSVYPVQIKTGVQYLPNHYIKIYDQTSDCSTKTVTGTYTCLRNTLIIERQYTIFYYRLFLPTALLVILSWISFWFDPKSTGPRTRICVGCLLSVVILISAFGELTAIVQTTLRAMDVWIVTIFMFIFLALLEFLFVYILTNHEYGDTSAGEVAEVENGGGLIGLVKSRNRRYLDPTKCRKYARLIDYIARGLFPAVFAIFNIVFWSRYRH